MEETVEPKLAPDADKLSRQLEKAARKLEGNRREHFGDERSLCNTCSYATITRRASKNNRSIRCSVLNRDIPEDIVECSDYSNITVLSLDQMARIAWIIDTRDNTKGGYL